MGKCRSEHDRVSEFLWVVSWKFLLLHPTSRSRAAVARRAHNPKVGSSILPFATKFRPAFNVGLFISIGLISANWRTGVQTIPPKRNVWMETCRRHRLHSILPFATELKDLH